MAFDPKFSYNLTSGVENLVSKIKEKIMAVSGSESKNSSNTSNMGSTSVTECVNCISCGVACSQALCDDCLDMAYPKDRAKRMTSMEKE